MLNTRIRGVQIKDGDITVTQLANDAVETAKIKDKNVTLGKLADMGLEAHILVADASLRPVSVAVSGDIAIAANGAVTIQANAVEDSMVNDNVATGLAGDGLSASTGIMALDLNELTEAVIDVAADYIAIVDANDGNAPRKEAWADIITAIAGTGLTATAGVLSADAVADNLIEGDIKFENQSANCNGSNVEFTLAETPIANSVQVFLNGLLQESGSGSDYTISGVTITYTTAPDALDLLLIYYIQDN